VRFPPYANQSRAVLRQVEVDVERRAACYFAVDDAVSEIIRHRDLWNILN